MREKATVIRGLLIPIRNLNLYLTSSMDEAYLQNSVRSTYL